VSKKTKTASENRFIPCTSPRAIGDGIFFRPVRSWHSNSFAGEKITERNGDRSGCAWVEKFHGLEVCSIPLTVTHRLYWHESDPSKTISAFLSYPDGMGYSDGEYFWEALGIEPDDVTRYFGADAETELETAIKQTLTKATTPTLPSTGK